ncbi:odorant receptor 94b-like [Colletes gigas]|uniref:odorant receptor 94b-like n=1 Tax=Colletes gigas TaxID=935657 RepID=UPI001C9B1D7C|nr:odorant receptor 94b-like [Colletes gigas]
MGILRRIVTLLTMCGCSRPTSWTSPTKKFLYTVYTIFVFLAMHTLVITQILDLVFIVDNQDDFSDNFYVTLAMIITFVKMCSMLITKKNIVTLIDTLQREPFLPMDAEEFEIRTQYDSMSENNTMTYTYAIVSYVIWMFLVTLILEFENRKLVFRAWLPFDYTSVLGFSIAFGHQIISSLICSASNVACDSLFSGLLIHIYGQFEILGYRLRHIERDNDDSVKQCARHHKHIYKFARMVNEQFKLIVFVQFLTSTSTVCFDLYRLTQKELGSESVDILLYASVTLIQIYYYCWYGNEVKLKSLEVSGMVFESDWTYLNNKTKRTLLMIMRRATVPIEFTSLYLVTVNVETFKALLKTAYSAYNVLQ